METGKEVPSVADPKTNPFTKEVTLPLSGKKVTMFAPTWGLRRSIKDETKALKLDDEEQTGALIAKCVSIDGEPLTSFHDFDDWLMHDYLHLVGEFNEWNATAGPGGKN